MRLKSSLLAMTTALAVALIVPQQADAAAAVIQSKCSSSAVSTLAFDTVPTAAAGHVVVAIQGTGGASFSGKTATLGGTGAMTQRLAPVDGAAHAVGLWDVQVTGTPTATVTFNQSGYTCIYELGNVTTFPGNYASSITASGANIVATIAGVASGDGLIAASWVNNTGTGALGFSSGTNVVDAAIATTWFASHTIAGSTSSTNAQMTGNNTGALAFADYISNGAGAAFVGSDVTRTAGAVVTAPGSVSLTGNLPTGGTAPYSYQWQRSTSPAGTYTNVTGATSLNLTDTTVTNGTFYCYRQQQSDSISNSYTSPPLCVVPPTIANINICFIGDSITQGLHTTLVSVPLAEIRTIQAAIPFANVSYVNRGVSGLATNDWVSGGSYLPAAVTACKAAGSNYVSIMLGTNDASTNYTDSTATYIANFNNITAYLNAQMPGVPIIINAPLYVDYLRYGGSPFDLTWYARAAGYVAALNTITGTNVKIGDTSGFSALSGANDYTYLFDGVHPQDTNAGTTFAGGLWANAFFRITGLGPSKSNPPCIGCSPIGGR